MTDSTVDVGGTKIFTRESGDGDPLLLLHGFPQTGHCWRLVAAHLADRFRVIVPDVPGFGASGAPPDHDAGAVAALFGRYLDQLGVSKATVVGHDWGGAFAFRMALDSPERVERLVITNSPFRQVNPWRMWYVFFFNIPVVPEVTFRALGPQMIATAFQRGATRHENLDDSTIRVYQEAFADPERVSAALGYYRTVTRKALVKQFQRRRPAVETGIEGDTGRRITSPTLIVWGMRDPVLTPGLLKGMRRDIPHAEIVELPGVGHFVPEEAPDALAEAIARFAT
ncbi:MAG: alpha/beta hydrolase [Actinomycetota bacterium]|nr:alpha/beta hydrolase [Actinomycetota bacterium]